MAGLYSKVSIELWHVSVRSQVKLYCQLAGQALLWIHSCLGLSRSHPHPLTSTTTQKEAILSSARTPLLHTYNPPTSRSLPSNADQSWGCDFGMDGTVSLILESTYVRTHTHTHTQTDRQTDTHTHTHRLTDTQTHRHTHITCTHKHILYTHQVVHPHSHTLLHLAHKWSEAHTTIHSTDASTHSTMFGSASGSGSSGCRARCAIHYEKHQHIT